MTCVILQPSYIPWRGYFDLIRRADVFVFYDDVQYDRHGWRNRNRVKTSAGTRWLTIPLESAGANWKQVEVRNMKIARGSDWRRVHFETLRHAYSAAPFYKNYSSMLARWYASDPANLADFTIATTRELAHELCIDNTRFLRSSSLTLSGTKTQRLLEILQAVSATRYLSGPAAKDYLDTGLLTAAGIEVEWMTYGYPDYPQLHGGFDGQVSILDLLFMTGPAARGYIWPSERHCRLYCKE